MSITGAIGDRRAEWFSYQWAGVCPHDWLPWLHRGGSSYTRCLNCGREEQWDWPETNAEVGE